MSTKTILVIEDNALNMKLVKSLLTIGKYDMLEAPDAETGIILARNKKPDLILMDIQLPGMDGVAATRVIKEDPSVKDIPVVAFTSFAMEGDQDKAMEAGCAGYITKPLNTQKFIKTIEDFLNNK
jgi:CheY-like chemotaxis protein